MEVQENYRKKPNSAKGKTCTKMRQGNCKYKENLQRCNFAHQGEWGIVPNKTWKTGNIIVQFLVTGQCNTKTKRKEGGYEEGHDCKGIGPSGF